jgi:hypothetical protein
VLFAETDRSGLLVAKVAAPAESAATPLADLLRKRLRLMFSIEFSFRTLPKGRSAPSIPFIDQNSIDRPAREPDFVFL